MATRRYNDNLVEAVCEDDRAWFKQNPGEVLRVRPYVPGEIVPPGLEDCEVQLQCECGPPVAVLVDSMGRPDSRWRRPIYAHDRLPALLRCADRVKALVTRRAS